MSAGYRPGMLYNLSHLSRKRYTDDAYNADTYNVVYFTGVGGAEVTAAAGDQLDDQGIMASPTSVSASPHRSGPLRAWHNNSE